VARMRAAASSGKARELRLAAQLTCAEIAEACLVTEASVWRWENGRRTPQGKAALRYAKLLESLELEAAAR
jgi:DNA-binding transcriptional regulator YiaG